MIAWRPRLGWVPTLACILVIALTLALGRWQLDRAATKERLQDELDQSEKLAPLALTEHLAREMDLRLRTVQVVGAFDPAHVIFLDGRVNQGVVGYEVVMPLRLSEGNRHVLVNRGWVAADPDRTHLPQVVTPGGTLTVTGLVVDPPRHPFELSDRGYEGQVWPHLQFERFAARFGMEVLPILLQQKNELPDGLTRDWPRPDLGIQRHFGYAFQWFSLAVLTAVIYVILYLRKNRQR
jgi:surfeit locus 1 family protein